MFEGATINTPSMLAVEDCIDALKWVESVGGLKGTIKRSDDNFKALESWVKKAGWVDFLATDPATRSHTSVCLKITDPWFAGLSDEQQQAFIKDMVKPLEKDGVAYDIAGYRDAPAGLRIWCGATVETADIQALTPWLDFAFAARKGGGNGYSREGRGRPCFGWGVFELQFVCSFWCVFLAFTCLSS